MFMAVSYTHLPESTVFVDLFGGSGLLSHITKRCKPEATVIYNDFDNYHKQMCIRDSLPIEEG